jgi:hypothetical protein
VSVAVVVIVVRGKNEEEVIRLSVPNIFTHIIFIYRWHILRFESVLNLVNGNN